jgi:hypothetical protein
MRAGGEMANWHGYIVVEDLALTLPQRQAILAAFNELGPGSDPQPAHLLQRRVALNGRMAIYEALFNEDALTVTNVKQFLATAVGIDPGIIDHTVTQTARGPLVTYSVATIDRMRFLAFGGIATTTWSESREQCAIYLNANIGAWQ